MTPRADALSNEVASPSPFRARPAAAVPKKSCACWTALAETGKRQSLLPLAYSISCTSTTNKKSGI